MPNLDLAMARVLAAIESTDDESKLRQMLDSEAMALYRSIQKAENRIKCIVDSSTDLVSGDVNYLTIASQARTTASSVSSSLSTCRAIELQPLADYEFLQRLGEGSSSIVYRAIRRHDNLPVAIKVLRHEVDEVTTSRFRREWRILRTLKCPQIVRALELLVVKEQYFIVMELIEGVSLSELISQSNLLSPERFWNLVGQIAIGLKNAHAVGVVHRDLKPNNLMVTKTDGIKILDFGLASLRNLPSGSEFSNPVVSSITAANHLLGTAEYAAPEQLLDPRKADYRSDLYSLGCIAYFLATGQPPFPRSRFPLLSERICAQIQLAPEPVVQLRSDLPAAISHLVDELLVKNPVNRSISLSDVIALSAKFCVASQASRTGVTVMDVAKDTEI